MFSAYASVVDNVSDILVAERWEFRCDSGPSRAGWRWRSCTRTGTLIAQSAGAFPSLRDALEDAKHHGFAYSGPLRGREV